MVACMGVTQIGSNCSGGWRSMSIRRQRWWPSIWFPLIWGSFHAKPIVKHGGSGIPTHTSACTTHCGSKCKGRCKMMSRHFHMAMRNGSNGRLRMKNMRGAFGPTPRSRTPQVTANEDGCAAGWIFTYSYISGMEKVRHISHRMFFSLQWSGIALSVLSGTFRSIVNRVMAASSLLLCTPGLCIAFASLETALVLIASMCSTQKIAMRSINSPQQKYQDGEGTYF